MMKSIVSSMFLLSMLMAPAFADDRFMDAGDLKPNTGSGVRNNAIFFPEMRFPLEQGPAYANTHLYGVGGQRGGGGESCDESNYRYPWRDNFCEFRSGDLPLCPSGGHQGQDIRPAACRANYYWAVAAEDGVIVQVGRFSVTLQTPAGTLYRYVHMEDVAVHELDKVSRGDRVGKVSNHWVSTLPIHLHFDVKDTVTIGDKTKVVFVPPYTSLVQSYIRLMGPKTAGAN